jgi:hypothetical protein
MQARPPSTSSVERRRMPGSGRSCRCLPGIRLLAGDQPEPRVVAQHAVLRVLQLQAVLATELDLELIDAREQHGLARFTPELLYAHGVALLLAVLDLHGVHLDQLVALGAIDHPDVIAGVVPRELHRVGGEGIARLGDATCPPTRVVLEVIVTARLGLVVGSRVLEAEHPGLVRCGQHFTHRARGRLGILRWRRRRWRRGRRGFLCVRRGRAGSVSGAAREQTHGCDDNQVGERT